MNTACGIDGEKGTDGELSRRFSHTYDPASLPLTESTTAFGRTWTVVNEYSKTNESWVISSGTQKYYLSFAGAGGLSNLWAPGIGFQQRSFDIYGRLEAVRLGFKYPDQAYHTDLAESVLTYDSRGRIASHDLLASPTRALASAETFGFDTADRLTSWNRTGLGAGSATYAYVSSGNLTTATVSGATTVFTSDAENRLTRSVAGSIVTTFTNDLYGRRTARITPSGTTTYTWDPSGHLSSVTSADTTVTYAYGITGMRESKIIETASGTTQTKSVWAGSELAAEQDSDGTRYTYLWGPDRTPLSVSVEYSTGATETFAYHTDALGSVVAMADESGSVVARYAYDPYGRCTAATGEEIATRNPLRYRAYYADAETGMFYLPARYYDPATYRFLSQDPAAPSAGDPLSLNAYAYCLGDPVGASDPSGAIALYDDDNHVDSYEVAAHNYTHSTGGRKWYWRREANRRQAEWSSRYQAARARGENRRLLFAAGEWGYKKEYDRHDPSSGNFHVHFTLDGIRVPWWLNREGVFQPHGKGQYGRPTEKNRPPDGYVDGVRRELFGAFITSWAAANEARGELGEAAETALSDVSLAGAAGAAASGAAAGALAY
ncbi:MAG: RHS repeat-associated core domain-containing protein [Thermoleophilia bacterium]